METPQAAFCYNCRKELVSATGHDKDGNPLCGACFEAYKSLIQGRCRHLVRKDDGVTCTDCGKRPWSFGRVFSGIGRGTAKACKFVATAFVMHTLPAILSTALILAALYWVAKSSGLLP